ncbi:MAG: hypothetical protein PHD58_05020 [Anaerolineales bacterium]|nr:hypothetical protein [Anaerolineales bacterium]
MEAEILSSQPIREDGGETLAPDELRKRKRVVVGVILAAILILALLVVFVVYLVRPGTDTQKIRDIFIIFMGLVSLLLGLSMVILIAQIARLINLLQNEIKPILDSTNETVNTLRGTTAFLSNNMVEPVMKLNEYLAALKEMSRLFGFTRRRS